MFATAKALRYLRVDKFGGYKLVRKMCAKLTELSLTTRVWDCTFIATVVGLLKQQRILINFNEQPEVNDQNFTCTKSYYDFNRM